MLFLSVTRPLCAPRSGRSHLEIEHQSVFARSGDADHQASLAFRRRQHPIAMQRTAFEPIDLARSANAAAAGRRDIDAVDVAPHSGIAGVPRPNARLTSLLRIRQIRPLPMLLSGAAAPPCAAGVGLASGVATPALHNRPSRFFSKRSISPARPACIPLPPRPHSP